MYTFDLPKNSKNMFFHIKNGSYKYLHNHKNYWEFMVVVSGEYRHKINGREVSVKENTLCAIRPNDVHSLIAKDEKKCCHVNIGLREDYLQQIFALSRRGLYEKLLNADLPQYKLAPYETDTIMKGINQLLLETKAIDEDKILLLFLSIFHILLAADMDKKKTHEHYGEITSRLIALISDPDNLALDLDVLIKKIGYSYPHANRVFLQETKQSLSKYFRSKKMTYAQRLLTNTNYTLDTIAQKLGYSSPYAFSYAFKNIVGCSPSQYAKTHSSSLMAVSDFISNATPPDL